MQQDPLEHFFGIIRLRCGLNNNPNALQFKSILRKLLVIKAGGVTPSLSSNCSLMPVDNVSDVNELTVDQDIMMDIEVICSDEEFHASQLKDHFTNQCLAYIAGYIVLKIEKLVKCPTRRNSLFNSCDDPLSPDLLNICKFKVTNVITVPSQSVYTLIHTAETFFHSVVVEKLSALSNQHNVLETLAHKILKVVNYSEVFPTIVNKFSVESVHELIKLIVLRYLKFRFLSFTKVFNQNLSNETSKRNFLNKYTLFMNQ